MNIKDWQDFKGEQVLRELGITESQKVLDFGCGSGVYSIIVAKIVKSQGKIYALDYNEDSLGVLKHKIRTHNIKNIEIIKTSKEISIPLKSNFLDTVLLYDVYHLLDKDNRFILLGEIYRVLKRKSGILSYFATHIDSYGINLNEVQEQLTNAGFEFKGKFKRPMFHWNWIEEGIILNYNKKG
ncbi:MAG: class I SAM-dependent methyltransferase [Promethearchaeota archaeon]